MNEKMGKEIFLFKTELIQNKKKNVNKLPTNNIMSNCSICIRVSILRSGLSCLCRWKVSIPVFRGLISGLILSTRGCLSRSRRSIIIGWIPAILRVNIGILNILGAISSISLSNHTPVPLNWYWSSWPLSYARLPIIC